MEGETTILLVVAMAAFAISILYYGKSSFAPFFGRHTIRGRPLSYYADKGGPMKKSTQKDPFATRIIDFDKLRRVADKQRIVVTSYFRDRGDPMYAYVQSPESHSYMAPWYDSMSQHHTHADDSHFPRGIIFCAGLSNAFIHQYETQDIIFVRCQLGDYSTNDERFFVYEEMLRRGVRPVGVIATDIRDIVINRNPFRYMEQFPSYFVFVGEDIGAYIGDHHTLGGKSWKLMEECHMDETFRLPKAFRHMEVCNAGCVGGSYRSFYRFVHEMVSLISQLRPDANFNMLALNYTLYKLHWDSVARYHKSFPFKYISGYPLTSAFKEYHSPETTQAYVIHK
jgi:hypothetical protein